MRAKHCNHGHSGIDGGAAADVKSASIPVGMSYWDIELTRLFR